MRVVSLTWIPITLLALGLVACGGSDEGGLDPETAALARKGERLFKQTCTACHGPRGEALPNKGKDIGKSEFVHSKTDEELVEFLKRGRPPGDPLNTTNVLMPPKGGNPALTDDDLRAIVAYIRKIQLERYGTP